MDLPKVIINDKYSDFLNGKEVEATVVSAKMPVETGMHVMGFHNSIATNTSFTVPRDRQSQYIGVEGMVTSIDPSSEANKLHVKVIKL